MATSHLRASALRRLPHSPLPRATSIPIRHQTTSSTPSSPLPSSTPAPSHTTTDSPPPSSANPTELSHFAALASTWWNPHGPSRLLHLMNPLRHHFINSCLASSPSPTTPYPPTPNSLRYLDVGCGGGIFAESAARLPTTHSVLAIDPSPEVLAVAIAHARQDPSLSTPTSAPSPNSIPESQDATSLRGPSGGHCVGLEEGAPKLQYLNTIIEALSSLSHSRSSTSNAEANANVTPKQYDVLTLFEVLEHITHPAPFLTTCLPHVKPGGWLVLSTIARTWTSWLTTKLVAEDLARIVPRGTHDWRKYVHERELRAWFAAQPGWEGKAARSVGVVYVPGLGWKEVRARGGEEWGNYFFGVQRSWDGDVK